jgi:hypothetical protein
LPAHVFFACGIWLLVVVQCRAKGGSRVLPVDDAGFTLNPFGLPRGVDARFDDEPRIW